MTAAAGLRERPILFSGPMVKAILDGRKSQTRRVLALPEFIRSEEDAADHATVAWAPDGHSGPGFYGWMNEYAEEGAVLIRCPFGVPGDRLWVRETFRETVCLAGGVSKSVEYRADALDPGGSSWSPSIFMPRWASRITLEVTEVRVQRVQEITNADAQAEGVDRAEMVPWPDGDPGTLGDESIRSYLRLWDSLNAKRGFGWEANPWVWAVSFRRLP